MNRIVFLIDGFNLYHALDDNISYHKYKWLNLAKLSKCFITKKDKIVDIFYFTAYTTWNPSKMVRHKNFVKALRLVGIKIVLGAFRRKKRTCRICHRKYLTFEEKRTDVNISTKLFQTAINDIWDTAIILSGDSDLIPAIIGIKTTFPAKRIGIVIPIGRRAEELKQTVDFHMKLKEKHLKTCQFDDVIVIDKKQKLIRPSSWG